MANAHYFFDGITTINDTTLSPPPGAVDIRRYGAKPDGSNDAGPAINAAITAAGAGGTVWIPTGTFKILTAVQTQFDDLTICGDGRKSVIYWPGWATQNPSYFHVLQVLHSRIEIFCLRFLGDNGDALGHGFQWATGSQVNFLSSAIGIGGGTHNAPHYDISVHHCWFENLYGFSVQMGNGGIPSGHLERVSVCHNYMLWNAQGLNVNSRNGRQSFNTFYNSEGIEAGADGAGVTYPEGMACTFEGNVIRGAYNLGLVVYSDNCVVKGNVIDMSEVTATSTGQSSGVNGISLLGARSAALVGNTVRDPGVHGILVQADDIPGVSRTPIDFTISGNTVLSTRTVDASSGAACALLLLHGVQRGIVTGNTLRGSINGLGNFNTFYGVWLEACSHVSVGQNAISNTYAMSVLMTPGSDHVTLAANDLGDLGQYGFLVQTGNSNISLIGNQAAGASIQDFEVDSGATHARLIGNVGTTVSLDGAAVKYAAGNSWQDA